jgi:hypothetical protein
MMKSHLAGAGGSLNSVTISMGFMSMVDYPYTASTCDVTYCIYYGGENFKYYIVDPPPSPIIGGQR